MPLFSLPWTHHPAALPEWKWHVPPSVQYSTIEKDYHFEELPQFKQAVGTGFNVMTKNSDKYRLTHL